MELFEFARLICEAGSGRFLTWLQVYWSNNQRFPVFPQDFTYLMTASFLGLRSVVDRLSEERGEDVNARSKQYGTALNIAALRRDKGITRKLLQKNVNFYIVGKEF